MQLGPIAGATFAGGAAVGGTAGPDRQRLAEIADIFSNENDHTVDTMAAAYRDWRRISSESIIGGTWLTHTTDAERRKISDAVANSDFQKQVSSVEQKVIGAAIAAQDMDRYDNPLRMTNALLKAFDGLSATDRQLWGAAQVSSGTVEQWRERMGTERDLIEAHTLLSGGRPDYRPASARDAQAVSRIQNLMTMSGAGRVSGSDKEWIAQTLKALSDAARPVSRAPIEDMVSLSAAAVALMARKR